MRAGVPAAHASGMVTRALRLFLLRFLPRRLAPILLVWEAYSLFRRFRRRDRPTPVAPRRVRTVGSADRSREERDRSTR
jgi:hypothetical protein